MKFNLFNKQLSISIIAAGDIGQTMGAKLIETLKAGGIENVKGLAMNAGKREHFTNPIYDITFSVTEEKEGFARNLDIALENVSNWKSDIIPHLQKIIPKKPGLMLLITGSGGTGISSILTVSKILKENYNLTPPIVLVFPERFENSRVHYNMAEFLYKVVFSNDPLGNNVILIDNMPTLDEMELPFEILARQKIEYLNRGFTNLLVSTMQSAYRERYDASLEDLEETFHTPGISFLVHVPFEKTGEGEMLNLRYVDILVDEIVAKTSMTREEILESRKIYCAIIRKSYETIDFSYEAPRFVQAFENTPFLKFIQTDESLKNEFGVVEPSLNAIVAGLPVFPKLIQAFKIARDARKDEILSELDLKDEAVEMDLKRVHQLEKSIEKLAELNHSL